MTTDSLQASARFASETPTTWRRRLSLCLGVSLLLHGLVLALPFEAPRLPALNLDINPTIELGFEQALPGADHPPAPPPEAALRTEAPRAQPPRRPRRVNRPTALVTNPEVQLPTPPPTQLRDPTLAHETPMQSMFLDRDASAPEADVLLAQSDDAGLSDPDAGGLPALLSASPELAPAVPQGSVITLLLRTDRLRDNPNGARVRELMLSIPDWQEVLGGTEIDPLRDFDQVLLASANPFGTEGHPPDVLALVRLHADRRFVRASIEQMAGVRASMAPDGGSLYERFRSPDAGRLPPSTRPIWQNRGGAEIATLNRYLGPHAFILLGNDTAAIAPPERVPALLSVLSRVPTNLPSQGPGDPSVVALLHADGLRNLLSAPPGPVNPIPVGLVMALQATQAPDGSPDGGAILTSRWRYESPHQAEHVVRLSEVLAQDLSLALGDFERSSGGRIAALTGTVHFDRLRRVLRALRGRAEGAELVIDATLDPGEVAEVLNVQRLAASFQ